MDSALHPTHNPRNRSWGYLVLRVGGRLADLHPVADCFRDFGAAGLRLRWAAAWTACGLRGWFLAGARYVGRGDGNAEPDVHLDRNFGHDWRTLRHHGVAERPFRDDHQTNTRYDADLAGLHISDTCVLLVWPGCARRDPRNRDLRAAAGGTPDQPWYPPGARWYRRGCDLFWGNKNPVAC